MASSTCVGPNQSADAIQVRISSCRYRSPAPQRVEGRGDGSARIVRGDGGLVAGFDEGDLDQSDGGAHPGTDDHARTVPLPGRREYDLGILFGMLIGSAAQLIVGRSARGVDWGLALAAGIVGSFIGGLLISLLSGDGLAFRPSGIIGSLAVAIIVTLVWQWWRTRRAESKR